MTQRMISVKTVNDLPEAFQGKVSFQVLDNNVEAVIFTLGDSTIRVVQSGSYSTNLKVLMLQPKKQVTKYKIVGTIADMTVQPEVFDDELKAKVKIDSYNDKFYSLDRDLRIESVVEFVDEDKI